MVYVTALFAGRENIMIFTIIIIVSQHTPKVLECFFTCSKAEHTQLMVVDVSGDDTLQNLLEAKHPHVTLITMDESTFKEEAYNHALSLITTPYVVFIESDDDVLPQWEYELTRHVNANPESEVFYFMPQVNTLTQDPWINAELYWHNQVLKENTHKNLLNLKLNSTTLKSKVFKTEFLIKSNLRFESDDCLMEKLFLSRCGLITEKITVSEHSFYQIHHESQSYSKIMWSCLLKTTIQHARSLKKSLSKEEFKQLEFSLKDILKTAIHEQASWVDITKTIVDARKLGIW